MAFQGIVTRYSRRKNKLTNKPLEEWITEACQTPMTVEEISKITGISEAPLRYVLKLFVEMKIIRLNKEDTDDIARYQATEPYLKTTNQPIQQQQQEPISTKIVVLGDSEVGKTTLLSRIVDRSIEEEETIGVQFHQKTCQYKNQRLMRVLWELVGDISFSEIYRPYCRNTGAGIFVFDTTRKETLESIDRWLSLLPISTREIPLLLIENKIDLDTQIPREAIMSYLERYNADYIQMGLNDDDEILEKAFENLVTKILKIDSSH